MFSLVGRQTNFSGKSGPRDPRQFHGPWDENRRQEPSNCPPAPPWDDREGNRGPEGCFGEVRQVFGPQDPRPFHGPANVPWNKEDRRRGPHDCPPPPPWDDREGNRGPEGCFGEFGPQDPRPFHGPASVPWNKENKRQGPHDCPPAPPWDDREGNRGPEGCFGEFGPQDPRPFHGPANVPWDKEDRRRGPHDCPPPPPWDDREGNRGPEGCFGEFGPQDPRPFHGPANVPWDKEDRRRGPHDCPPAPPWDDREGNRGPEGCFGEFGPQDPRPFHGPANVPWDKEDRRRGPHDCPPAPPWDDREGNRGPEGCFGEVRQAFGPRDPRPFHGPASVPWDKEDRRRGPHDCPPPPPWDDREGNRGPEGCFGEEPQMPDPNCIAWPEFPDKMQHPPRHPARLPWRRGGFRDGWLLRGSRGRAKACSQLLHLQHQKRSNFQHLQCTWRSRGNKPSPRSFSGMSNWRVSNPQHRGPPKSCDSRKQKAQVGPPAVSSKVPEPPTPASTPQRSPAADPQAATTEAVEPEQAAGAMPVESETKEKPAGSHSQGPSALEMEPAPPEESSAETEKHPEVKPCSQSVPEAGAGGGSHPSDPTDPLEPVPRDSTAASSVGEVGAELHPRSQGRQHLQSRAGETEAHAAGDGHLGGVQPSENLQVPTGAAAEPDAQPSQASLDTCTTPETSTPSLHPPGSSAMEPDAGGQQKLCSMLPTPSPASMDLRSAAILARKEEIELSYQQFSLTIAVVATMLLHKEPSMEAALGLALRANLRQGRIHHLQELEDFINNYDSSTLSH
ncbi:collagen alpha-1(XI) chain-like isoform X4 [Falco naumanni]|uniref:collagen alpha-1(XI) chain-like isoform X4 n=1 Tax=Falco naumanni TaxID=148594 RepID=UPI001ADE9790|nr:collagen alpha-1(XI) chain-like isoform X4 [Falco naumanni]